MSRRSSSSPAVPARLVPDNLKTGVDKPDLYDPKINRSYAELAEHYGTLVDPARAAKPKDKPRVERPMPYVRDSFWRGREFVSLHHMTEQAVVWCREVAGRRQCRPLGGAAPLSVFDAVEASELTPLPRKRFVLATWSTGTIGPDIHVRVGKSLYSVPWRHLGRRVDARETPTVVQIFDAGELIATHGRRPGGKVDRSVALPAGEGRVHNADTGLVPQQGRRHRPVVRRADRRAARGQRPVPVTGSARGSSASPANTTRPGWRRLARGRSRSATRLTAR
jgi:hypothetical protein